MRVAQLECRCCRALRRPDRMRITHGSRLFATSSTANQNGTFQHLKLPTRNWGDLKGSQGPSGASNTGSQRAGQGQGANPRRQGNDFGRRQGNAQGGPSRGGFGLGTSSRNPNTPQGRQGPNTAGAGRSGWGTPDVNAGPSSSGGNMASRMRDLPGLAKWATPSRPSGPQPGKSAPRGSGQGMSDVDRDQPSGSGFGMRRPGTPIDDRKSKFAAMAPRGESRPGVMDAYPAPRPSDLAASNDADTASEGVDMVDQSGEMDSDISAEEGSDRGRKNRAMKTASMSFKDRMRLGSGAEGEEEEEFVIQRGQKRKDGTVRRRKDEAGPTYEEKEAERKRKAELKRAKKLQAERKVFIPSTVTVARLASILGQKWSRLQIRMAQLGMSEDQRRSDYILNEEEAVNVALDFGFDPVIDDEAFFDIVPDVDDPKATYPLRPPIVTIMGHVDHGKTTLLDALRNTAVAAGEAGGITQHIGAFSVPLSSLQGASASFAGSTITFLDTPGHAAFTEMRARGATVTDIVVLVVAADDGVMPQTREVLNLVKEAGDDVGLVVAINKVDKPGVDVEKIKNGLGAEGIHLEEDGGDVPSVRVSGLAKMGLDNLVETLSTLAELRELRARSDGKAQGYILESHKDHGRGIVATVLVTKGTIRVGSVIVAGTTFCRIRTMINDQGHTVDVAGPGTPVLVTGWRDLPEAGDELLESVNGEVEARKAIDNRLTAKEQQKMLADAEVINLKRQEDRVKHELETEEETSIRKSGGNLFLHRIEQARRAAELAKENHVKELRLIIKGDVSGTVEAVEGALSGIGNKEASVKVVSTGVGAVSESDLAFAEATGGLVIGFNVECSKQLQQLARQLKVPIHLESVIYRLIETVRQKTAELLPPLIEYRVTGEATVQQVFEISGKKKTKTFIAGCRVSQGAVKRGGLVRVLRGPERKQVYEGTIETLKHLKKDVDEIRKGTECGMSLENFKDLKEGDEIVAVNKVEVPRTL